MNLQLTSIMKPFLVCFIILMSCTDTNFPNMIKDFEAYTGIKSDYKTDSTIFKNNQSIVYATISDDQKSSIQKKYTFRSFISFKKDYENAKKSHILFELYNFRKENNDYVYFFNDKYDLAGYYIICLSKKSNRLIFCEVYPETPFGST